MKVDLGGEGGDYGYSGPLDPALAVLKFKKDLGIEKLDEAFAAVIEDDGVTYEELLAPTRLFDEYWRIFYEGVYETTADQIEKCL